MTLNELSETLPNGFHDAQVKSLRIDYVRREVAFDLIVWVGDVSSDDPEVREACRPGLLTLSGLLFCSIDPPDSRYPFRESGAITIDTGMVEVLDEPSPARLPVGLPAGSFTNWIFVQQWNAFVYIAASHASLSWQVDVDRRSPA